METIEAFNQALFLMSDTISAATHAWQSSDLPRRNTWTPGLPS
ncbi:MULTISPECIES: hypothetical protein [Burkholderia]|nr:MULTISPECIES: hypothetical protein [Burkholderia]